MLPLEHLIGNLLTFPLIQWKLYVIIIYALLGVLDDFTKNIEVELGVSVDDNMFYMLSHLAKIGTKQCLLLEKVDSFLNQFPHTCINNCVTMNILLSTYCVIHTYIILSVHKSAL